MSNAYSSLTVEDFQPLVVAYFRAMRKRVENFQLRFWEELGVEAPKEEPEIVAILKGIEEAVSGVIAGSFIQSFSDVAVSSSWDDDEEITWSDEDLIVSIVENTIRVYSVGISTEELAKLRNIIQVGAITVSEVATEMTSINGSLRQEFWRWITEVYRRADEIRTPLADLLGSERELALIESRAFTKREFVEMSRQVLYRCTGEDYHYNNFVQNALDTVCGEDEKSDAERSFERASVPFIGQMARTIKETLQGWIQTEADRIYSLG